MIKFNPFKCQLTALMSGTNFAPLPLKDAEVGAEPDGYVIVDLVTGEAVACECGEWCTKGETGEELVDMCTLMEIEMILKSLLG